MNIEIIRHSLSHVLAAAVQELYPQAKFGMGPNIENGFYYDFQFQSQLTPADLPKIEKKMRELIKKGGAFEKKEISEQEAEKLFKDQPYKLELVNDFTDLSIYQYGNFTDLCTGPHVESAKDLPLEGFKLTEVAGAYWKGSEKNPMLTRIYGLAFAEKKELDEYLKLQEEAAKRDHRKLGKELDLFCFSDLVGPGLPMFTPKGTLLKETLQKEVERICRRYGFEKVSTPHLAKIDLYEVSGHAKKFSEELFSVSSPKGHKLVMKPVQCPHQTQIYASKPRSYKDLPIRYMESEKQYRAEKPGEVGGLTRVYAITCEDGHTFCTKEQVKNEIKGLVNIIKEFYETLGLWGNHWVSLSTRGEDFSKYIGEEKDWDLCEKILKEVSDEMNLQAKECPGEAALYGPKLDFMFKDALGKEVQIPTVQIDFATPKRFGLVYTDSDGTEKNPVMVHRAILGSYERFLALIIEHFGGAFPFWLAPVQMRILPLSEKHLAYAEKIKKELAEFRVELDIGNETIGKKIRNGEMQKIPYLLIVGDKEEKKKQIAVRERGQKDLGLMKLDKFIKLCQNSLKKPSA